MSTKKQNFAAAAFISPAADQQNPPKQERKASAASETKTRRVQLLLKPSDYAKLRRIADKEQCSVNRVIELLIADTDE